MKLTVSLALLSVGLLVGACKKDTAPDTAKAKSALEKEVTRAAGPSDIVYAASNAIRVIDFAKGEVIAQMPLKSAVSQIRFSGSKAFVAASQGLFVVNTKNHTLAEAKWLGTPVRAVDVDDDGQTIDALTHEITVNADTSRDIKPFRLVTLDAATGETRAQAEVGQRIYFAVKRPAGAQHDLVLTEGGDITLKSGSEILSDEGTKIDPHAGISTPDQPLRVRHEAVRVGGHAYLPVEGYPSRVLDVDLKTGQTTAIPLDRAYPLRGIGVTADQKLLLANVGVGVVVIDLDTKEIRDRINTPEPTTGIAISADSKYVYTAQVVDGTGGAIHALSISEAKHVKKVHLDDISPWALAVMP